MSDSADPRQGLSLRLRALRPKDLRQLMAIEEVVFPVPWPASVYARELRNNPNSHYYALDLVRHDSVSQGSCSKAEGFALEPANRQPTNVRGSATLIGYAGFWLIGDEAHLMTIAVAPEWQGRGIGEWMLLEILDRMEGVGAGQATLEVRVGNTKAISLYRRLGFEVVGRRRRYYSDNDEDALIMTTLMQDESVYRLRARRRALVQSRLFAIQDGGA